MSRGAKRASVLLGAGTVFRFPFLDYDDLLSHRWTASHVLHGLGSHRNKICGGDWHHIARPRFPSHTCVLYRNRGDGTFDRRSERRAIAAKKGRAHRRLLRLYDADGFTDIFVVMTASSVSFPSHWQWIFYRQMRR